MAHALSAPMPRSAVTYDPARLYAAAGLLFLALIPPTLLAFVVDDRQYLDTPIWLKPLKFEVSLALFFATLALCVRWLPARVVASRWHGVFAATVVAATAAEIIWIMRASALGIGSHFNETTRLSTALFNAAGAVAVYFTMSTAIYGLMIWRSERGPRSPAIRLGVSAGLILTFVLTVVFAGTMGQNGGHNVGVPAPGDPALAIMGWSRTIGDLRVAHFFGTHAMQVLPLAALLASVVLTERRALLATAAFSVAYVAFSIYVFVQAFGGQPFLA